MAHLYGILAERFILVLDFTVYADESGIHDERGKESGAEVTVIAGYLASKQGWRRFTQRWRQALRDFGVAAFHMNEVASHYPPYDQWSPAKVQRFLSTMIEIAGSETWFPVGALLPTKDWDEVMPEMGLPELRRP